MFSTFEGETGMPLINDAPVSIECRVIDKYEINGFDNFILDIASVYVDEQYLSNKTINYKKLEPVLFEFPTYEYLTTGKVLGKCLTLKKRKED